jgi:hypothetical protein
MECGPGPTRPLTVAHPRLRGGLRRDTHASPGAGGHARQRLAPEPSEVWQWVTWTWLHWYVALRAEAAVLAGSSDARNRVAEARTTVAGNPIAEAIVERADALLDNDQKRLLATAAAFDAAGCHYQSARTLVLAGGDHATRGAAGRTPHSPTSA